MNTENDEYSGEDRSNYLVDYALTNLALVLGSAKKLAPPDTDIITFKNKSFESLLIEKFGKIEGRIKANQWKKKGYYIGEDGEPHEWQGNVHDEQGKVHRKK